MFRILIATKECIPDVGRSAAELAPPWEGAGGEGLGVEVIGGLGAAARWALLVEGALPVALGTPGTEEATALG